MNMPAQLSPRDIPVLLTSSVVAHDTSVRLKDTNERVRLALESVAKWLAMEPAQPIVLCDGSGCDFTEAVQREFPVAQIECLHFDNDKEMIRQFSRGYGEGEIVRHAVRHSRFIAEAGCFAKCTSKLWVENFRQCAEEWNGRFVGKGIFMNVFSPLRKTKFAYIDTRFYIASAKFYQRYFEEAHKRIGMREGKAFSLEDSFHEIAQENRLQGILLRRSPVICGVGGGTGVYYRNTPLRQLKEDLRLQLVSRYPQFRAFFP
jgi:hypothetical protein